MIEVKLVDSDLIVQFGLLESEFNGVLLAMLRLQVDESFEYGQKVSIFLICIFKDGIQLLSHDLEPQVDQFFLEVV